MTNLTSSPSKRTYLVTDRDIKRFCQAIGVAPTAIAPPLFCQIFMFEDAPPGDLLADGSPKELDVPIPAKRVVGGGSQFEIFEPVKSGDTITVESIQKDVVMKQGKQGPLYLVSVETTFKNQHKTMVARETATYVKRH